MIGGIKMTSEEVLNIPAKLCPMMVFSYGVGDPIATVIAIKEKGMYNHFMWLIAPGVLASQGLTFKEVPLEEYMKRHALKFVHKKWTKKERYRILSAIHIELAKPWYKRMYDPLAIFGQLFNLEWLQIPGVDICSDKGKYLKLIDINYDLKHPSPTNINNWMKQQKDYIVYGRYRLD